MYLYNNMMDCSKLILVLVLKLTFSSHTDCSNLYGRTCPYLPAPLGQTPLCARPGQTFCEHPDNYPEQLIMFLAKQARYNHRSLVIDETKDEFKATAGPYPAAKYPHAYKEIDITTSTPLYQGDPYNWQSGVPISPYFDTKTRNISANFFDGYDDHQDGPVSQNGGQFLRYKYTSNIPHAQQHFREMSSRIFGPSSERFATPAFSPFRTNFLWKRDVRRFMHERIKRSELLKRHMREIRESPFKKNYTGEATYIRPKRQNDGLNGETLCQSRSSFIMPRAAMNKDGNWMYVVNMEDSSQKYTQLVRSEVCASQTCSSICGLPNGYTSRCEQKYIQKRLIALQGQGDQLYTDVFWIPSCCVCTIQRN